MTEPADPLASRFEDLTVVADDKDEKLFTGELIVRQAGKKQGEECDVVKAESFLSLPLDDVLKGAIAKKGWQEMSKIQEIGIPLFLSEPKAHLIAQAQAGTGKTGTFVISALARMDLVAARAPPESRLNRPQVIILGTTQELVNQIHQVVSEFANPMQLYARRVMSSFDKNAERGGRGGRGGASAGAGRGGGASREAPAWELTRGADFQEQIVVGTAGKVKNLMMAFKHPQKPKPYIDPSDVRVLIFDEADEQLSHKALQDSLFVSEECPRMHSYQRTGIVDGQIGLFSATYSDALRDQARKFVGNDPKFYHEITINPDELVLDKVDNLFIVVGDEQDDAQAIDQKKYQCIFDIWESISNADIVGQSIIFLNDRVRTRKCAEFLRQLGSDAGQIHGDMPKMERERVFNEFRNNQRPSLVTTNVLAKGIDNQSVNLVINVDLPLDEMRRANPTLFVHRIGRAGRWNKGGASVSLISANPAHGEKEMLRIIEQELFANVDRPLIQVVDASKIGDEMVKGNARRDAKRKQ